MSIESIEKIKGNARAAATSTVEGTPVHNPHRDKYLEQVQADILDAEYEQAMCELGCFA